MGLEPLESINLCYAVDTREKDGKGDFYMGIPICSVNSENCRECLLFCTVRYKYTQIGSYLNNKCFTSMIIVLFENEQKTSTIGCTSS